MLLKSYSLVFGYILFIWKDGKVAALEQKENNNVLNLNKTKFKIRLGGLFALFSRSLDEGCDKSSPLLHNIETTEKVFYALDQINNDPKILPGVELVFNITAVCFVDTIALNQALQYLGGHCHSNESNVLSADRYWGLIGPDTSGVAVPVANLLGLFRFPQISCGATSTALSDKKRFPSFFRTVPSDIHQVNAIIELLLFNQWHYVSFIHEDDDYGNAAYDAFRTRILNTSICVAQEITLKRNTDDADIAEVVQKLKQDLKARVVIGFIYEMHVRSLLKEVFNQNLSKSFQWIGSDAWSQLIYRNCSRDVRQPNASKFLPMALDRAMFFRLHASPYNNFEEYLRRKTIGQARNTNPFFAQVIAEERNCSLEKNIFNSCSDDLTLPRYSNSSNLRSAICPNAMYAFAFALDNARKDLCRDQELCNDFKNMSGSLLTDYLRNVSFNDSFTNIKLKFDSNQDGPVWYDIVKYEANTGCWNNIGEYTAANKLSFYDVEAASGHEKVRSTCSDDCSMNQFKVLHEKRKCCWHCVDCPPNGGRIPSYKPSSSGNAEEACYSCKNIEIPIGNQTCELLPPKFLSFDHPLSWPVVIASSLGFVLTLFAGVVYVWFWNTPLIRASGRELSSLILIGIFLIFSAPLLFCVKPTNFICGARRFSIGFAFSLVFSCLLVKTVRISIVFNVLGKRLVKNYKTLLLPCPQVIIALFLTSVEVFVLVAWFISLPPQIVPTVSPIDLNNPSQTRYRYIDCKGLKTFESLVGLGYPFLVVIICTFYAIKIRKVPSGFNEAKFIGFAVYTTLVIWLAQLSTYIVEITAEIELRDAIYCMCLSLNGLVILLALFGPKVYIAILRPEKNNQATVMSSKRNSIVSQVSTTTTTKFITVEDIYLGNSHKGQNSVGQVHSNLPSPGLTRCSCGYTLHNRYANTLNE